MPQVRAQLSGIFVRCYNAAMSKIHPGHGCRECRRSTAKGDRAGLKCIRAQFRSMAYPTLDVEIYECETCGGLWLRTPALGYMKNLRENKAKELAPDLRL